LKHPSECVVTPRPQTLFLLSVRAHDFRSVEQDFSLAFNFSLDYPIQEMMMQIVACSSFFINHFLFLLSLGR
jgi:hypothetical protein